jgi:hypothetical protein
MFPTRQQMHPSVGGTNISRHHAIAVDIRERRTLATPLFSSTFRERRLVDLKWLRRCWLLGSLVSHMEFFGASTMAATIREIRARTNHEIDIVARPT